MMNEIYLITNDTIKINIKVIPGAKKTELHCKTALELRVRIQSPPDKGKANAELIAFLAKTFSVAKNKIQIIKGDKNRHKTILVGPLSDLALKKVESIVNSIENS